jgi:hypothetical protein
MDHDKSLPCCFYIDQAPCPHCTTLALCVDLFLDTVIECMGVGIQRQAQTTYMKGEFAQDDRERERQAFFLRRLRAIALRTR